MEEEEQAAVNFISCIAFVGRGIAKENPEKVIFLKLFRDSC